jgi:hypothetical protein
MTETPIQFVRAATGSIPDRSFASGHVQAHAHFQKLVDLAQPDNLTALSCHYPNVLSAQQTCRAAHPDSRRAMRGCHRSLSLKYRIFRFDDERHFSSPSWFFDGRVNLALRFCQTFNKLDETSIESDSACSCSPDEDAEA